MIGKFTFDSYESYFKISLLNNVTKYFHVEDFYIKQGIIIIKQ